MAGEALNLQFALLGKSGVGKTCLFKRFFGEADMETDFTIKTSAKQKEIIVNHLGHQIRVKLRVWDTIGMEKFQALMPQYYRSTHGFVVVYDITSRNSFENLDSIFTDMETFATYKEYAKILVGNKIDKGKERQVSRAEGLKYAHSKDCLFIEASALTNEAVEHILEKLTTEVLSKPSLCRNERQENVHLHQTSPCPLKFPKCICYSCSCS